MPRNYKRKTSKGSWSVTELQAAAARIRQGVSMRKVAKETGIPFSTLQKRMKKETFDIPKLGRHPVFNEEQENTLTDRILLLSKIFHGLTINQLRKIAFQFAESLKLSHNFNRETKMAGKDWIKSFLKRNPRISVRKPEAISIQRITGFNKTEVSKFFNNLEEVMTKTSFPPQDIYNIDETGITTVQETEKILATKGQKRVGSVTSWERGKTITVICCMSAVGTFVPPMFIYPRKRHSPQLEKGGPLGAVYENSKNGWTNDELFIKWLQHFVKTAKPSEEKPVLLILDNHYSHVTLDSYNFCREHFITMVSIPPHTSHRLQPLDVVFYGPLKKAYNRECDVYIKSHNLQKITPYEVAGLFNKAYMRVASVEKGVSGFASTGIFPLNPHKFKDEDFMNASDAPCVEEFSATTELEENEGLDHFSTNNVSEPIASTSSSDALRNKPSTSNYDKNFTPHDGITQQNNIPDVGSITSILTQLTPLPNIETGKGKGKGKGKRTQQSEIITATPKKDIFEEKAKKRKENKKRTKAKGIKKIKAIKKNIFKSSSSEASADEQVPYNESGDSNLENIDNTPNTQNERADQSLCMICREEGKPREVWYRCRLCGGWAHEACTGCDDPSRYLCDYCV